MKKLFMGVLLVTALAVGVFAPVKGVSAATPGHTDVTGIITDGGVPVAGASVTVKCGATTLTDTTDASGTYLVNFMASDCPPGSTVKVTATKGSKSGSKTGVVIGITTKLNLGLVNVDIPEYGLIGALLAGAAGVGAIAFTRRRFAQAGRASV